MTSVALIGPDGAGKTTVGALLMHLDLPAPVTCLYMGVNLEASRVMLPTTRALLAVKRRRGGRPDLMATNPTVDRSGARLPAAKAPVRALRLAVWLSEEWYRAGLAWRARRRGHIVVFDRHFFADYYHYDVAPRQRRRSRTAAAHGFLLRHAYPKPDLVICLDAPGEVLHRRKNEATVDWLEQRRQQYLELRSVVEDFEVVDVDRPLDVVAKEVADIITRFWNARQT